MGSGGQPHGGPRLQGREEGPAGGVHQSRARGDGHRRGAEPDLDYLRRLVARGQRSGRERGELRLVGAGPRQDLDLGLSIEEINEVGREGEFAFHGIPSGVDNTASTYGGLLHYSVRNEIRSFERIELKEPFRIVLANSGVTADTSKLDGYVLGIKERDPAGFQQIMDIITGMSWEMRAAFESNDLETVGAIMTANHAILIEMGLSHEILDELCERAIELGALGAKVTGGGRGGYMSALTPDENVQEAVAASFEADGYKVIRALIGDQG